MKHYFTTNGERNFGPFTLEELRAQSLCATTLVWHRELEDWTEAYRLEELTDLFEGEVIPPPQIPTTQPINHTDEYRPPMPSSNLGWAICSALFCCTPLGIVAIFYAAQVESAYRRGQYAEAQRLADKASMWATVSAVLGLIYIVMYVLIMTLTDLV